MKVVDILICPKKDVWRLLAVVGGGSSFGILSQT
jgi:hypothetical protein